VLKVDQCLVKSFIDGAFGIGIAHENLNYTRTTGTAYAEIRVLNNDVTGYDTDEADETDGVFRVALYYPQNAGAITAKTKADAVMSYYYIGRTFAYDGQRVIIRSKSRAEGLPEAGWYKIIVSITYKAFIGR
jgi:hypothetical protein